jgi:hypothetical protein
MRPKEAEEIMCFGTPRPVIWYRSTNVSEKAGVLLHSKYDSAVSSTMLLCRKQNNKGRTPL